MTLGIAIVTRSQVFQSSDYCVSSFDGISVVTDNSTKVVTFQYRNWIGNLTYSGIGMWKGRHTSQHALDWMSGTGPKTFAEVAEHLRAHTEQWLLEVNRNGPRRRHTFVLVGFEEGNACVSVISNLQPGIGVHGGDRVVIHTPTIGRRALVIVTGQDDAVTRTERNHLKRAAERCSTPTVVNAIMRVNRSASARRPNLISGHCNVTTLSADGTATTICRQNDSYNVVEGFTFDAREAHKQLGLDPDAAMMTGATASTIR